MCRSRLVRAAPAAVFGSGRQTGPVKVQIALMQIVAYVSGPPTLLRRAPNPPGARRSFIQPVAIAQSPAELDQTILMIASYATSSIMRSYSGLHTGVCRLSQAPGGSD